MRMKRGWLPGLTVAVLADALIGYLALETLDSFTGARYSLPLSGFLRSIGLTPLLAGVASGAMLAAFTGAFVVWLWRFTPEFLGASNPAEVGAGPPAPMGLKVGETPFGQAGEKKQFVDVVHLEGYPLNVYAAVTKEEDRERYTYEVIEPTLSQADQANLASLKKLLIDELDVDLKSIGDADKAEVYISAKVKELARKYRYKIEPAAMTKLLYYLSRDFIHLGRIEPLMRDKHIEDISCDGPRIPIYIWYRDYESIPTNVVFESDEELDSFVSKLAYSAGKHVSLSNPIVDASLADGSRLHLTYGKEITQKGSTFTIRKFRADPLTIVDLIKYNTLSSEVAAYLWYLIEKKLALLVAGGTASGKSIADDEKVLLYRDTAPALVPIADLFEERARSAGVAKEGIYETASCDGIQTAAFGADLKVRKFPVRSVVRHKATKRMYLLRTKSGRKVKVTGDHSLFTIADGRVTSFPTSRIVPGMFVAVPRSIPGLDRSSGPLNLIELLANGENDLYVENIATFVREAIERLGETRASEILGIKPRFIRRGLQRGFLTARVNKFFLLATTASLRTDPGGLFIRSKTNRNFKLCAALRVTNALARFLGYWTAEGMYQKRGVSLFQLDPRTRADMLDSARAAFGLNGRPNPGDRTRMDFGSSVLKAIVKAIMGKGTGAGSKRIPSLAFGGTDEVLTEFLRGYFTGDASAGAVIEASTKSQELAHQLQYALARFEIVARVSPNVVKGVTYYRVTIYGQPNLRRFEERIGFLDEARRARLRDALLTDIKPHTNVDAIPGIGTLLKEALAFKRGKERKAIWSDWHSYWAPQPKRIGRGTLVSFARETSATGEVEERLLALAYADIIWDEVAEIETFTYDGKYVYDLEVPGAQNFVGGSGGLFLHNTTSLNSLSMFIEPGQKIVSVEDSVTRDAEILVKQGGVVRKVTIGEIVDDSLGEGSVRSQAGHELARVDGLEVLTSDGAGRTFWSPCTALIRHKVNKEFVKVTTKTGRSITVTGDHSLFSVGEDGSVTEVLAGTLDTRSFVAAPSSYPPELAGRQFDLGKPEASEDFVFKPGSYGNGNGLVVQQSRVHGKHSPLSIPTVVVLDEDLAFLAGLWLAAGFYGDRTVGFSVDQKRLGPRLESITRRLGLHLTRHRDGNSLLVNSEPLRVFFETVLGLSGDDYSRHVPDLFFGADQAVVGSLLRGFFTGDGTVTGGEIEAESASRTLLTDLQTLLLRWGIVFAVGTRRKVGTLGGAGTFRGKIAGTAQVAKFKREIGFEDETMAQIVPRPKTSKYYLDAVPLNACLSSEIREHLGGITQTALGQRLRKGLERGVLHRGTLLELGRLKPEYQGSRGFALASSAYYFDRVVSIEKERREEAVYDLSVPETGRFIANNVLCHNTPELNLPHENWVQSVTRGVGTANEITMFDLVKTSLRQRPDVLIVGEVRGEEAFTLLQSIATGHGGLGTIHADSVEAVINRLTTEPMNIPRSLVGTTLDCIVMQLKLRLGPKSVRRMVGVTEVVGYDPRTNDIILNDAFKWDPVTDKFSFTGRSKLFDKISSRFGTRPEEIRREIDGRRAFLDWLVFKNLRSHAEVSQEVRAFYAGPYALINKARAEMEGLKA